MVNPGLRDVGIEAPGEAMLVTPVPIGAFAASGQRVIALKNETDI
jgi:hypothetical protein